MELYFALRFSLLAVVSFFIQSSTAFAPTSKTLCHSTIYNQRKESSTIARSDSQLCAAAVPKLIVLDLDDTLWTPSLAELRKREWNGSYPVANRDVHLFPSAVKILEEFKFDPRFANTKLAIASRTKSGEWAHNLLEQFGIRNCFEYLEIYSGDKKRHFESLRKNSGLEYKDMLFFDDSRDGTYGNCVPVASLGVLAVHCPNGICDQSVWENGLDRYNDWMVQGSKPNTIVESNGILDTFQPILRFKGTNTYLDGLEATKNELHADTKSQEFLLRSPVLGDIRRLRLSEDDEEDSFLGAMGVPTFAADESYAKTTTMELTNQPLLADRKKSRGLEGVLNHGPAFVVDGVLTNQACEQIIADCENLGFGSFASGKNVHGAQQIVVDSSTADAIAQQLAPHIDVNELEILRRETMMNGNFRDSKGDNNNDDVRLYLKGLNRRFRIYKYDGRDESFAPHIDAGFPPSGVSESGRSLVWDDSIDQDEEVISRLTVLMYLNDDFVGGETNFFAPLNRQRNDTALQPIASVRPVQGSVLCFPQGVGEDAVEYARMYWPLHEGSPVVSGRPKYVIRSDVLFATHIEEPPFEDDALLFEHDKTVRQTFVPKPSVWDRNFLSQAGLLYNPCMGVENLGPFLYSFLRMTKRRRIVEIGAGFTTVWILQALKDNDIEMQSVRSIQQSGECKLLNIDWTIHPTVDDFDSEPSKLFCIDNCEHQRETASGAGLVAKSLGLDSYLEFRRGDAFDMKLPDSTIDVLWCDFGVGARMREFISSAWDCIRPGGFLLCHSTLTNENTRTWLEAIRNRQPKTVTGIEPGEYTELSLLESHKRFQNSVSILQKRKSSNGNTYEEPIYSQYA